MISARSTITSRPPGFSYESRSRHEEPSLYCEDLALADLAERFGTPLYVYSEAAIRARVSAFQQAFRNVPHSICYSVKANSNLGLLRLLAQMKCGFDIVSGGELGRVLQVRGSFAENIVFSGVGKTVDEMRAALKAGILLFNVESDSELHALADLAARAKKVARIALRVNPNVPAETHPYISTGLHQHKFGIPIDRAMSLYEAASRLKFIQIAGVSVHIGSQITDMTPFKASMERVADLVRQLRNTGLTVNYIDAGGGLGISYRGEQTLAEFREYVRSYAKALLTPLRNLKIHLLLEPGRSIVGPSGVLVTRVLYKKSNGPRNFLVVDAAMNDLVRPSLYSAYHEIVPLNFAKSAKTESVDVVGPICETGDFFARDRHLPETEEGDLLALLDAGAYGMVLASNYNSRPRPAEILVHGRSAKVIRRREKFDDLVRLER